MSDSTPSELFDYDIVNESELDDDSNKQNKSILSSYIPKSIKINLKFSDILKLIDTKPVIFDSSNLFNVINYILSINDYNCSYECNSLTKKINQPESKQKLSDFTKGLNDYFNFTFSTSVLTNKIDILNDDSFTDNQTFLNLYYSLNDQIINSKTTLLSSVSIDDIKKDNLLQKDTIKLDFKGKISHINKHCEIKTVNDNIIYSFNTIDNDLLYGSITIYIMSNQKYKFIYEELCI